MIFTFKLQNSTKTYIFFAVDKEEAFLEMKRRLGREEAEKWVLLEYCEVEEFSLFTN